MEKPVLVDAPESFRLETRMDFIQRTVDNYNLDSSNSEMQSIQIRGVVINLFIISYLKASCRKRYDCGTVDK